MGSHYGSFELWHWYFSAKMPCKTYFLAFKTVVVKYMGDTFLDRSCEKRWRFGGAVDTGRAIQGCQTPLLGLMAIFIKGLPGDAEEPGDHDHTENLRSDQSQ
jgi:hypothetical protein